MLIVSEFGSDVWVYARQFAQLTIPRPKTCPHCDATDRLIGHGNYPRIVLDHRQAIPIRVKRYPCAACRKTIQSEKVRIVTWC